MARSKKSHWMTRADDYRALAKQCRSPEARQVLEHLERLCAEMARREAAARGDSQAQSWLDPFTHSREQTAERWRMRKAEYLAMAESCSSSAGRASWYVIARRCGEIAAYLEAMAALPSQRPAAAD